MNCIPPLPHVVVCTGYNTAYTIALTVIRLASGTRLGGNNKHQKTNEEMFDLGRFFAYKTCREDIFENKPIRPKMPKPLDLLNAHVIEGDVCSFHSAYGHGK